MPLTCSNIGGFINDGKSWYSEGNCIRVIYLNRGGSLREGRAKNSPRSEAGGFFYWGHVGTFFAFFSNVFLTSIFFDFSSILEGFWRPKCVPKSIFGELFGMFFGGSNF